MSVKLNNSVIKEYYIHMDDNNNSKYSDQSYEMNTYIEIFFNEFQQFYKILKTLLIDSGANKL